MKICSDNNHGEIVYKDRECPACERIQRQLAVAQREAEQETPEPEDELTAYKRHRALEEETCG